MNLEPRSTCAARASPKARSFCREYILSPWPILRCPMRFTSYLPGFRGFSSAMDGLEAADDSDFEACAVALTRSGAFGSEANRCCEHNSKPVQTISRTQGRMGEERSFIRDPWVGRELYTSSGSITTAIALLRPVKVLSHLGEVLGFKQGALGGAIVGSACWKDGKSKARRSIYSPQRQAPQSPARSSSGRMWSTRKSKAGILPCRFGLVGATGVSPVIRHFLALPAVFHRIWAR